jgi:hypothetical protein
MFEGDHNSARPDTFFEQVTSFFISTLNVGGLADTVPMGQVSMQVPFAGELALSEEEQIRRAIEASLNES